MKVGLQVLVPFEVVIPSQTVAECIEERSAGLGALYSDPQTGSDRCDGSRAGIDSL